MLRNSSILLVGGMRSERTPTGLTHLWALFFVWLVPVLIMRQRR